MKKILFIEDDHRLAESVVKALQAEGYSVVQGYDGQMALKLFQQGGHDLVVLDLSLPLINGIELCKRFRAADPSIPIIITTAFSDIDSKMEVFALGADDYLVKPFHLKELVAKVKVFLKRVDQQATPLPTYQAADISLDPNRKVAIRDGKEISLTPKEFGLLEYLLKHRNRIVSKDELAINLWDANYGVTHNTIEVYINFLRNKIDKGFQKKLLLTKPGFGYYLNQDSDEP